MQCAETRNHIGRENVISKPGHRDIHSVLFGVTTDNRVAVNDLFISVAIQYSVLFQN